MKKRIDKKNHKKWLLEMASASLLMRTRNSLLKSRFYAKYNIDISDINVFNHCLQRAIKKYHLEFMVAKIPAGEADPCTDAVNVVAFKIWAKNYPSVCDYAYSTTSIIQIPDEEYALI